MSKIVLCADSESLIRPELLYLNDVELSSLPWIESFFKADELRSFIRSSDDVEKLWLFTADDMGALNVASAIHKDKQDLEITLICASKNAPTVQQALEAGISEVIEPKDFALVFAKEMAFRSSMAGRHVALHAAESQGIQITNENLDVLNSQIPLINVKDDRSEMIPISDEWTTNRANSRSSSSAFIMSVVSGSGGVGKSVLACISAIDAASRGMNTLLIDCDLQFGDIHSILGITDYVTIDELLGDANILEVAIARSEHGLPVFLGAPKRLEYCESVSTSIGVMVDVLSEVFDVIVINTGSNWAEHHAVILEKSSCSLFLMDQRASSVRACQHAVDLCMRMGVATGSFAYALNRCAKKSLFSSLDIAAIMQGAQVFELNDGGIEVEELCGSGKARSLFESTNPFKQSVSAFLDEILPSKAQFDMNADKSKRSLLDIWERRPSRSSSRRRGPKALRHQLLDSMIFPRRQSDKEFAIPKGMPVGSDFDKSDMGLL